VNATSSKSTFLRDPLYKKRFP